jgi:hypothetical protein
VLTRLFCLLFDRQTECIYSFSDFEYERCAEIVEMFSGSGLHLLSRTTKVWFSAKLISASERYDTLQTYSEVNDLITGIAASYEKSFTILTRENFCFVVDLTFENSLCLQNVPRVFVQSFYACSNWITESYNTGSKNGSTTVYCKKKKARWSFKGKSLWILITLHLIHCDTLLYIIAVKQLS